jgi:cytochrome oxidase Cu insertion factor (SCO1/SenC/PrrC family)
MRSTALLLLGTLALVALWAFAGSILPREQLPKIAPAPDFALTSQDGAMVKLADFRGKVVAVTFIFTKCTNTCPVLTPMMSFVQDRLGADFGSRSPSFPSPSTPSATARKCCGNMARHSAPISPAGPS